jgi:hypothetical protein
MNTVGRPKKLNPHVKTVSINVSHDEMKAIRIVSKKLKYKSISTFLRSIINWNDIKTKGGHISEPPQDANPLN